MSVHTKNYDTIVIGAGQAGLATGYYLQQDGCDFVILDANERTGDTWRKRWDSLRLFTPAHYNQLPGMRFPAPSYHFPTKDEMADYLETYAAHFQLPIRTGVYVDNLAKVGERYAVKAGDQRFAAHNVVVATGAYQSPNIPAFAAELDPDIVQLHSSEYQRPSQLRDGNTLVVGASNSGVEIALELAQSRHTWLSGRHPGTEPTRPGSSVDRLVLPLVWFVFSHVLNVNNPIGRKLRPNLLNRGLPLARIRPSDLEAAGVERIYARTVAAQDGRPVLDDGRVLDVANVVWCSGFRSDFGWIDLPVFDDDGEPLHERGIVPGAPGLYFVGLFFLSAANSSLVGGVGRDASRIAGHIVERARVKQPDLQEGVEVQGSSFSI